MGAMSETSHLRNLIPNGEGDEDVEMESANLDDDQDGMEAIQFNGAATPPAPEESYETVQNAEHKTKKKIRSVHLTSDQSRSLRLGKSKIHYFPTESIGNGISSTVYRGYFEDVEVEAAVKAIDKNYYNLFENEIRILRKNNHENIVRYFASDSIISENRHYIAMELAPTTLEEWTLGTSPAGVGQGSYLYSLKLSQPVDLIRQALEGLQFLHSRRIVHRDIKPSNILLFNFPEKLVAKLTDFGISKDLVKFGLNSSSTAKGTPAWMSPETLAAYNDKKTHVTEKSDDIFSMGISFAFALTKTHPFGSEVYRMPNILQGKCDLKSLSPIHYNVVNAMLSVSPQGRPKAQEVLEHPCFWSGDECLAFVNQISNYLSAGSDGKVNQDNVDILKLEFPPGWISKLDPLVQNFVYRHSPKRKLPKVYDSRSIKSLIEFIRDKDQHYAEIPEDVRNVLGHTNEEYGSYFNKTFPTLIPLIFVHFQKRRMDKKLSKFYLRNEWKFLMKFA